MLDALLSSGARIKLLTVFLLEREGRFYLRELVKKTGLQLRSVQVELKNLTDAGILIKEISGRQTYYSVNEQCPIIPELRSMFIKTVGIADVIRDALSPLSSSIRVAFVFGSFARGDIRPESDVDVMIIGGITLGDAVQALHSTEEQLGREINPAVFPPDEFRERVQSKEHFVTSVLDEPKIFLIGGEDELEELA